MCCIGAPVHVASRPVPSSELRSRTASSELSALTRLAFDELGDFAGGIGKIERGIAERAFWGVGPAGRPVQLVHDEVTRRVHGALRGSTALMGRVADAAIERRGLGQDLTLSTTRPGSAALAALGGLMGDRLEREGSALHLPAAVRVGGEVVALDRESLRAVFPGATPWPVIFLHGLMETEFSWTLGAGAQGGTYGTRLADELGCTPVYVRYNSGRHVSENGRSVADLLESLASTWPVEVERLAIVGHSMGGLVGRSAAYQACERGDAWPRTVGHVVSLGTPHMGAPLEQAVHALSAALNKLPETRGFGAILRRRSAGIRDLRRGSLVDEDWEGRDADALRTAACREVPLLDGATHCFVSASVTRSEKHPLGRLLGDCLVLVPSASGRGRTRRLAFKAEHGAHLGGATHFALLNHPKVYGRLHEWLSRPPASLARAS